MRKPKLIFFDAGGTLFEPRQSVGETYSQLARNYGFENEAECLQANFLLKFRAQPPLAFPHVTTEADLQRLEYEWWRGLVAAVFNGEPFRHFDEFFAEAFDYYRQPHAWHVFDDVLPTLQTLQERGVPCAVLSNFDSRLFELLQDLGLARYFAGVHISARLGAAKPAARIFAAALQAHGVQPQQAWHVGDSLREDFAGARNAGLQAWLINRAARRATPPAGQLSRLDQLVDWLL